jgi:hypothetical protein
VGASAPDIMVRGMGTLIIGGGGVGEGGSSLYTEILVSGSGPRSQFNCDLEEAV